MFWYILHLLIHRQSVEERVSQGFLESHPPIRFILQHPGDEVKHDTLFLTKDTMRTVSPILWQWTAMLTGISGCWQWPVPTKTTCPWLEEVGLGSPDDVGRKVSKDSVHHGEMFQIVMRLEQGVSLEYEIYQLYWLITFNDPHKNASNCCLKAMNMTA